MDIETDLIEFDDIDICDTKHVLGPPFRQRRSILFVTIADAHITLVDIEKMMEMGMNVARLKTSHSTKSDKVNLMKRFDRASSFLAQKYGLLEWPIATAIELKTSVVQTGILEEEVSKLHIHTNTEIILTCEISEFDKCSEKKIFVDNPYLTSDVRVGMEINISQDEIILKCLRVINERNVLCYVTKGGYLQNMAYVCMRGAIRTRPYISRKDLHLIKFAVEYQLDMIIINYPRHIDTITKIKRYLGSRAKRPSIITGISTQEGLLNVDDFIREADGILLSREFLAYEVDVALYNRMGRIQSYVSGKCQQAGKPFYISGEIFSEALLTGNLSTREISDVTNAIMDGASGFVLSETPNIDYMMDAMREMNALCASVEPLCMGRTQFWRLVSQIKMPVNAAEASGMSCAVVANQTNARCVIVPTVTARTAYLLNWLRPNSIVIAVSTKPRTIRLLKTYRSITPLLFRGAPRRTWFATVQARINFALQHAVEKHWINYGDYYVTLEKGTEESSFCDAVRVWKVTMTKKNIIECPESTHDFALNTFATPSTYVITQEDIRNAKKMLADAVKKEKTKHKSKKSKRKSEQKDDEKDVIKEEEAEEGKEITEKGKETKKDEQTEEGTDEQTEKGTDDLKTENTENGKEIESVIDKETEEQEEVD